MIFLACIAIVAWPAVASAQTGNESGSSEAVTDEALADTAMGTQDLAFAVLRDKATPSGNVAFSPVSIAAVLALAHEGAEGVTREQLAEALGWDAGDGGRALGELLGRADEAGVGSSATAAWLATGLTPSEDYEKRVGTQLGATLRQLDFADPSAAAASINQWAATATQGKVSALVDVGSLSAASQFVLTQVVTLEAAWASPFEPHETQARRFYGPSGKQWVAMMQGKAMHGYAKVDGVELLELRFGAAAWSMVVLMPAKRGRLKRLEKKLTAKRLARWMEHLEVHETDVSLPRFVVESSLELDETLRRLGVRRLFTEKAELGRMGLPEETRATAVVHRAVLEVDEEGAEGAAGTALMGALNGDEFPEFVADHPFLVLVLDRDTGALLFLARVVEPERMAKPSGAPAPATLD